MKSTPASILVIRIDGIGDLLCITPMLQSLRQLFPEAHIDVLANLGPHTVLKGNQDIDELLIDYRTKVAGSRLKGLYYLPIRLFRWLKWKTLGYDLVLVAHYGIHQRAVQLARNVRAKQVLLNVEPAHQEILKDSRICFAPYEASCHETEGVHALLYSWNQNAPGRMWLSSSTKLPIRKQAELCIGINLSASGPDRVWPQDLFKQLISVLSRESNDIYFNVIGNATDIKAFERLMATDNLTGHSVQYVYTPTLEAFINAIAACDLLISGEGGTTHMASALLVPQVALFVNKPEKLKRWAPWSSEHITLHAAIENAPVSDIELNSVLKACRTMIKQVVTS